MHDAGSPTPEGPPAAVREARTLSRPIAPEPLQLDDPSSSVPFLGTTRPARGRKTRGLHLDPIGCSSAPLAGPTEIPGVADGDPGAKAGFFTPHGRLEGNAALCPTPVNHGMPGHIWFNSPLNSAVAITPYSQIYGVHPRLFDFDKNGTMQPTPRARPARRAGSLSQEALTPMQLLAPPPKSPHAWFTASVVAPMACPVAPPAPPLPTVPVAPPMVPGTPYLRVAARPPWPIITATAAVPRHIVAL